MRPQDETELHGESGAARSHWIDEASTTELLREIVIQSAALVRKEIQLARSELARDLSTEIRMARRLAVAAVCALAAMGTLVTTLVLLLSQVIAAWASALFVSACLAVTAALAGLYAWRFRVRKPLPRTQKTLKEDLQWAKHQLE